MPELPDVEAFKRVLTRSALRKTITGVTVNDARILDRLAPARFIARLNGSRLVGVQRHGKHLFAGIDGGGWLHLHFGMTGELRFLRRGEREPPFTRVRFDFAGDGSLAYVNKRMIGHVGLVGDVPSFVAAEELGPDALDRRLGLAAFETALLATRRDVKSALMDQRLVAGIGNIYSDEILFQAGIDPALRTSELSPGQPERLFRTMREVLRTAIAHGAGSERFVERMPKGSLLPERRKDGHCPRCRSPLKVFKAGGRTGYCCPRCQNC
jgi:formamidopyrimidine-DNA glycosylase